MSPPIPPVIDMASAQPTDALFSLMDTASGPTIPTPIVQTKTNISTETPIILIPDTPITPIMVATEEASPLLSEIESTVTEALKQEDDHPMSSVGKELARMTRSPRLQGKLIGFISGLEELSKEEELLKNEKRKQIESYKIRISELKAEYETRIHALELEEQNLMEQIVTMDEEREHITQVIDGFKRELEVV